MNKELRNLLSGSLEELVRYVERAKPEVEQMADAFYSGAEETGLKKVPLLLEGMGWILEVLEYAVPFQSEELPFELLKRSLLEELTNIEEALKYQDWTMLADLLQYQVNPLLDQLKDIAQKGAKAI